LCPNSFKNLGIQVSFYFSKYLKLFVLFFKWQKEIQPIQLSYLKAWRFQKSYLVIHFNFKNAVWYELKDIKRTKSKLPIILNLENIKEDKIEFTIYGLFRKKTYLIDVSKSESLIAENFKTAISQIKTLKSVANSIAIKIKNPSLKKQQIKLRPKPVKTNLKPITLKLSQYNQNEFL
jgi:hypothetical protein